MGRHQGQLPEIGWFPATAARTPSITDCTADAARITRPELKVLFITGYAENAIIGSGHLAPGMRVLTKPFVVETLANRIHEMIGDDKRR